MMVLKHKWQGLVFSCLTIFLLGCLSEGEPADSNAAPFVILKLDDLRQEDGLVHTGWVQVMEFLDKEQLVGTVGLIGESLEEDNMAYFNWLKNRDLAGFEIWNHGYCHCKPMIGGEEKREFRGTAASFQREQIVKTQDLAKEKLGIRLHSFGAPYNATDTSTAQVLDSIPELEVWMYKETKAPTSKYVLHRIPKVNIEYPVHNPDFDKFKEGYLAFQDEPVLVIQGHPRSWVENPERFEEFKKIVLFLKQAEAKFITPYNYYLQQGKERQIQ